MIQAQPNEAFEAVIVGAPTGLVGSVTIKLAIPPPTDDDVIGPHTSGIVESVEAPGTYQGTMTAPGVEGLYWVVWENIGTGFPVLIEELRVSAEAGLTLEDVYDLVGTRATPDDVDVKIEADLVPLEDAVAALPQEVWDQLTATLTVHGSIGEYLLARLVDWQTQGAPAFRVVSADTKVVISADNGGGTIRVKEGTTFPIGVEFPVDLTGAEVLWQMKPQEGTGLQPPSGVAAKPFAGGGVLTSGVYYYRVTAKPDSDSDVESMPSHEAAIETPTTDDGRVELSWNEVEGARVYRVYRRFEDETDEIYFETEEMEFADDGTGGTDGEPPETDTRTVTCDPVDLESGKMQMTPDATTFDTPGVWWLDLRVTFPGSIVQFFPQDGYLSLEVLPSL